MRVYFLPLLFLVACEPGKDEGEGDTGVDTDTTDTDTGTDPDTDTDTAADTADTDTDTAIEDTDTADTGPDGEPTTPPDGAALYSETCAPCHGANGEGTGDYPGITGEVDSSDADLLDIILNGKSDMPPQPLTEAEAQAVIDWMRATF